MAQSTLRDPIQVIGVEDSRLELIDIAIFECLLAVGASLFMRYELQRGQMSSFAFRLTNPDAAKIAALLNRLQNNTVECYRFWE